MADPRGPQPPAHPKGYVTRKPTDPGFLAGDPNLVGGGGHQPRRGRGAPTPHVPTFWKMCMSKRKNRTLGHGPLSISPLLWSSSATGDSGKMYEKATMPHCFPTHKKAGVCAVMPKWILHIKEHMWTLGICPPTILLPDFKFNFKYCRYMH